MDSSHCASSVLLDDKQLQGEGWNNPTYDKDTDPNCAHENRRGRPKAASITNLMMEGAKSRSAIKCKYCGRVFPREKSLQAHHRTHTGEKPYACNYPGCLRAFTQSGQLKTHQRLHTGEKPFVCSYEGCENRFTHANRHCPNHPDSVLTRCDSSVLRPVFLNPIHSNEVVEWLEQYKKDRKSQQEIVNRKLKNTKLRNEEVENNDVKPIIRKIKQYKTKEQIKRSKSDSVEFQKNHLSPVACNCTGRISSSYHHSTESLIQNHDKSHEQKVELPKKRWLREASLDQSLKDLNQSRPTVLMIAGKENEGILLSPNCYSDCDYSNGIDNGQKLFLSSVKLCDSIKSEEGNFEDYNSNEPSFGRIPDDLGSGSVVESSFNTTAEFSPLFSYINDKKGIDDSYFDSTISSQPRITFKKQHCEVDMRNHPDNNFSVDSSQYVPSIMKSDSNGNHFLEYSKEMPNVPHLNETCLSMIKENTANNLSSVILSPSLMKPYLERDCFSETVANVQPQKPLFVPTERVSEDMNIKNNTINVVINTCQEFPTLESVSFDRNDNICNTPELNMDLTSHTPPTPSKWHCNPTVSRSTPLSKISSAYKKRMHNRFLSQFDEEESHLFDKQELYPAHVKHEETYCVIVNPSDIPKKLPEQTISLQDNDDTVEEELAYPLTPVPLDSKPLNLSSSSSNNSVSKFEYFDL